MRHRSIAYLVRVPDQRAQHELCTFIAGREGHQCLAEGDSADLGSNNGEQIDFHDLILEHIRWRGEEMT